MGRKSGNLLELLIDKVILAVVGLVCLWVLFAYVVGSPNAVEYDGRDFSPGEIDKYINNKAKALEDELGQAPEPMSPYSPNEPKYLATIENTISGVDTNVYFPVPGFVKDVDAKSNIVYRIPTLPKPKSIATAGIKMAAFVPSEELTAETPYLTAATTLDDLYLITVEARIPLEKLYEDFHNNFAGKSLKASWRNEKLATPVFAAVEMQRQKVNPDGTFGPWETIGRIKTSHLDKQLEVPEKPNEYELEIAMHQFTKQQWRNEILQPLAYDNAIPAASWLSPSFYNERQEQIDKRQEQARRDEIEAERADKLRNRSTRKTRTPATRNTRTPAASAGGGGMGMGGMGGMPGMGGGGGAVATQRTTRTRQPATRVRAERVRPTTRDRRSDDRDSREEKEEQADPEQDFAKILLSEEIDMTELEELVFWAHDDTAAGGNSYQYRIRIGVFNPIFGTGWFSQDQQSLADSVVLWTDYAPTSDVVEVPKNLYLFPTDIRRAKSDDTIDIKIARFTMGNWVTKDYKVKNGDMIGRVDSVDDDRFEDAGIELSEVDFATGFAVVDIKSVVEWVGAGVLRPREYNELIYVDTDGVMARIPVKQRHWSSELVKVYDEIKQAGRDEPVVLLGRDQAGKGIGAPSRSRGRTTPGGDMGMPGMGMPGMGMPGMMPGM